MSRILATLILAISFSLPSWSQDEETEPAPAETADATPGDPAEGGAADGAGPAVDLDENPELDQQTHEKDDDEFVPTEEIPVDQSIPFPTDI